MKLKTIDSHPILEIPERKQIDFKFNGNSLIGFEGMVISSALFMNRITTFGHHPKDGTPQGIFCANGQCAQCTVIADNKPVKACMTKLKKNMNITSCEGLPELPADDRLKTTHNVEILQVQTLIIGAGPSGLSATKLLAESGMKILLIDDKDRMGGKLILQTHKFFGSQEDVYAGKRGIEIAKILSSEVKNLSNVSIWLNSTAIAVFSDGFIGILKDNENYVLVKPEKVLITTGAREKMLIFPGDTLPGVYGAGAFQTLVNRDLVKASEKIFIVGGGNVGLIAGYHAIQAGIEVVGLIEALPNCGGYHVHENKLRRLGVPIYTRHTIISANGADKVESITIGQLDDNWKVIEGSEKTFPCDTILIAVGLNPVNEFYQKAKQYGYNVWVAGDAQEIAEASAAIFTGRIAAQKILESIGLKSPYNLDELERKTEIMKKHPPTPTERKIPEKESGVFPIFHCDQEIPCNPCTTVCPQEQIETINGEITQYPYFKGSKDCIGCGRCVAVCPGLAVTIIDFRKDNENPNVTFPYEIATEKLQKGDIVTVCNDTGDLGQFSVANVRMLKDFSHTQLVALQLPKDIAKKAVGIKTIPKRDYEPIEFYCKEILPDDAIVCRCERVTAREIRQWIRKGVTDFNELKALTHAGMGACGAKTCTSLIQKLFNEEGIPPKQVTPGVLRPTFIEVPLGKFAGIDENKEGDC